MGVGVGGGGGGAGPRKARKEYMYCLMPGCLRRSSTRFWKRSLSGCSCSAACSSPARLLMQPRNMKEPVMER